MFDLKLTPYWNNHYRFDKSSKNNKKRLGQTTIQLIIINTMVPFLFIYGKLRANQNYQDKAIYFLEQLKPEKNHIITHWKALGLSPKSAYDTQAMLQLKTAYCDQKKCLECAIGHQILKA